MLEAMIEGYVNEKLSKGWERLSNGLFEDCVGNVFSVDLVQTKQMKDEFEVNKIILRMKKVDVIGNI